MAETKTKPTGKSVDAFIDAVPDPVKRADARALVKMMRSITGEAPYMWGPSIIGFGTYHYKYDSGHEGDACLAGFSPRSTAITVYAMGGLPADKLKRLGKHKATKGCLYIKRLADVDQQVLRELVESCVAYTRKTYGGSANGAKQGSAKKDSEKKGSAKKGSAKKSSTKKSSSRR